MGNHLYEIEWRKLLVKRLKTVQAVLRRDAVTEEKRRTEAKQLAAGYASFEEAHEAYGWACITEKQLKTIKSIFDKQENVSQAASRRLAQILGSVEGEIIMLNTDLDYIKEIIETEELE